MIIWDDSHDDDRVIALLGCPACSERRVDELVIHNDETVHCETCGHDYALPNSHAGQGDTPD